MEHEKETLRRYSVELRRVTEHLLFGGSKNNNKKEVEGKIKRREAATKEMYPLS